MSVPSLCSGADAKAWDGSPILEEQFDALADEAEEHLALDSLVQPADTVTSNRLAEYVELRSVERATGRRFELESSLSEGGKLSEACFGWWLRAQSLTLARMRGYVTALANALASAPQKKVCEGVGRSRCCAGTRARLRNAKQ